MNYYQRCDRLQKSILWIFLSVWICWSVDALIDFNRGGTEVCGTILRFYGQSESGAKYPRREFWALVDFGDMEIKLNVHPTVYFERRVGTQICKKRRRAYGTYGTSVFYQLTPWAFNLSFLIMGIGFGMVKLMTPGRGASR